MQKQGVIMTLLEQAHHSADKDHLDGELKYLQDVFLKNGYSLSESRKTFVCFDKKTSKTSIEKEPI